MNTGNVLGQLSCFDRLPQDLVRAVADLCQTRNVRKRDILYVEGSRGDVAYVLVSGSIQVYKSSPDGKEIVLRTVTPGDLFGEAVMFSDGPYPATAVAVEDSVVLRMSREALAPVLDDPGFKQVCLRHMSEKLRYLTNRIVYLIAYDVEDRLFKFFQEQHGNKREYEVTLSKRDVAAAIGATPETLSRLLDRLSREKKLIWKGKVVRILSKDKP